MKKIFFAVIIGFISFQTLAQEGLPMYTHYLVGDQYLLNPSYAGKDPEVLSLTATYRNQWADLPESPNTQTLSAHATVVDRLAFGLYIFNDKNGLTSMRGFNLSAAYHIPINTDRDYRYGETEDMFSFGLSYNMLQHKLDLDKIIVTDIDDPLLQDPSYNLNYFNLGVSFKYAGAFGGIAVQDIPLVANEAVVNGIEPVPTRYNFHVGYQIYLNDAVRIDPSVMMNLDSNSSRRFDLNLMSHIAFGDRQQGLDLGVSYRTDVDKNGSQGLSIAPIVKLKVGDLRLGFSYDVGLSDIAKEGGGGVLFSLGYDLGNPFKPDLR